MNKYTIISATDTYELIHQVIRELFPDQTFSLELSTSSLLASLTVTWHDGPSLHLVEKHLKRLQSAYTDSAIDYRGTVFHLLDDVPVILGIDFIRCKRTYSAASIITALAQLRQQVQGTRSYTVEEFQHGDLEREMINNVPVASLLRSMMRLSGSPLAAATSATERRIRISHDDGYSRSMGGCFDARSLEIINFDLMTS